MPGIQVKDKLITLEELGAAINAKAGVTSVNNQTGAVSITPANIGAVNNEIDGSLTFTSGSVNDAPLGAAAYAGDNSNVTQKPYNNWFTVFTFKSGNTYSQQVALPWFNNNSIAFRVKNNGVWGSWRYIATQATEPTA